MDQQTYQETVFPTSASTVPSSFDGYTWQNPSRIYANDGSSASMSYPTHDVGAKIKGSGFTFKTLPESAVIDGLAVTIEGTSSEMIGYVTLNIPGTTTTGQPILTLNKTYGGIGYFWGLDSLVPSDLTGLEVTVATDDLSGGDAFATMDYMSVTVYWHIELDQTPQPDLATRFSYKVYSKDNAYLGELPNVTSPFAFSQDINSAGSVIKTTCGTSPKPVTTTDPILTEDDLPIQTESDLDILATSTHTPLVPGDSTATALFKNGNRLKVWMYNRWHPNGKIMFSGQMNRIDFQIGGDDIITITSFSDGMDLENYIARGYPFSYSTDQQNLSQTGTVGMFRYAPPDAGWIRFGQSFTTGVGVTNVGQISLKLLGTATVTVRLYDGPNGNFIGSVTKSVVGATLDTPTTFEFPQLLPVSASTLYFFNLDVGGGQTIDIAHDAGASYVNGSGYTSLYGGGGGGAFEATAYDLWFKTASGEPTTTTTYTSDDPVTEMASGILLDYNSRGGRVVARDLTAAGYSLTYTFNSATILAAIRKILELSPSGYYAYVDLGLAVIDILPASSDADFTVVIGKDISKLDFSMTIERVQNTLLFSGGDIGGGVNLFKQYQDPASSSNYDPRLAQKSDNRVTLDATADAIGTAFIEENAGEIHETSVMLLNERVDITKYLPGKTIGFRNTGMFADELVLQIVRREFTKDFVKLTVGRLPVTQTAEVQRIQRQLLDEQTIGNPDQPD